MEWAGRYSWHDHACTQVVQPNMRVGCWEFITELGPHRCAMLPFRERVVPPSPSSHIDSLALYLPFSVQVVIHFITVQCREQKHFVLAIFEPLADVNDFPVDLVRAYNLPSAEDILPRNGTAKC